MMNLYICTILFCLLMSCISVPGYPVKRDSLENKIDFKDEKRYPNGTVVGKYIYKDKDGNPVHVKYFADDATYGVELKSVKIFDPNTELMEEKLPKLENTMSSNMLQPLEAMSAITTKFSKDFNKNNTYNPFEILNNIPNRASSNRGFQKTDDDYEIFLENDLKPFNKCDNKEKVKVYIDKNKRKTRNAAYQYEPSAYCERL